MRVCLTFLRTTPPKVGAGGALTLPQTLAILVDCGVGEAEFVLAAFIYQAGDVTRIVCGPDLY